MKLLILLNNINIMGQICSKSDSTTLHDDYYYARSVSLQAMLIG